MPYLPMLNVLAKVSLVSGMKLAGWVPLPGNSAGWEPSLLSFAQATGSVGWLGVLIVLLLLIPLVWWLRRSTEEAVPSAASGPAITHHVPERSLAETAPPRPAPEITTPPTNLTSETGPAETPSAVQVSGEPAEAVIASATPEVAVEAELTGPPNGSAAVPEPVAQAGGEPPMPDDLTIIEGIGPKIAGILQTAGITTLVQLANTDVDHLREILNEAGLTRLANPGTWPEQAQLAAAGDWDGFKKLQGELKGGRRVQ